jgi:hypothetical protein
MQKYIRSATFSIIYKSAKPSMLLKIEKIIKSRKSVTVKSSTLITKGVQSALMMSIYKRPCAGNHQSDAVAFAKSAAARAGSKAAVEIVDYKQEVISER